MTSDLVNELADVAVTKMRENPVNVLGMEIQPAIARILAKGAPASAEEVAAATGRPVDEIAAIISKIPELALDSDGRVLGGLGLWLLPTPHRVELRGRHHVLYADCSGDVLLAAMLLGEQVRGVSRCVGTGAEVAVTVSPDRVEDVQPPDAMVSVVTTLDPYDYKVTGCQMQPFFASAEAARQWNDGNPNTVIMSVHDAFKLVARAAGACYDLTR